MGNVPYNISRSLDRHTWSTQVYGQLNRTKLYLPWFMIIRLACLRFSPTSPLIVTYKLSLLFINKALTSWNEEELINLNLGLDLILILITDYNMNV